MVSDADIVRRLTSILRNADLSVTTSGSLQKQLEKDFGVSLTDRKIFIRDQIDLTLKRFEQEREEAGGKSSGGGRDCDSSSDGVGDPGENTGLDPQLWHACAGGMVQLPPVGAKVIYFPQGHGLQAATPLEVHRMMGPTGTIPCKVISVSFLADTETDEVYARIRLQPLPAEPALSHSDSSLEADVGPPSPPPEKLASFAKTLTQSDANNGGGFSIPRFCAETIFPPLDYDNDRPVQTLLAKDVHGERWKFRHIYRGTPRRHLLTFGWSTFVNRKKLVAGDAIVFLRTASGELCVGVRRSMWGTGRWGSSTSSAGSFTSHHSPNWWEVKGTESFSDFFGSKSGLGPVVSDGPAAPTRGPGTSDSGPGIGMSGPASSSSFARNRARVTAQSVLEAASLAANGQPFEVVYYPRASTAEFCVTAQSGKLVLETEDSSRILWFIAPVHPSDPMWSKSPWRVLQILAPRLPCCLPETAKEFIQQCSRIDPLTRPTATELLQHPFVQPLEDKLPTREGGRILEGAPKVEESDNATCERSADLSAHIEEIKIGDDEFKRKRTMEEPDGQLKNVSEHLTKVVKDFIIELKKREEDGLFVSTMWLSNLEEHEKVALILMLRSSGYSEVYDTSTTILYERVDQDSNSPTICHDESSIHTRNDVTRDSTEQATVSRVSSDDLEMRGIVEMENILPTFGHRHKHHHIDDIGQYGSSVQSRPTYAPEVYEYTGQPQGFEYLGSPPKQRLDDMDASRTESGGFSDSSSSRTGPFQEEILSVAAKGTRKANNYSCGTILKKEEKQPGNLVEQQSTTMETLMAALREKRLRSYFVSTEWLSNLDDHQKEIVKSICVENGYTKTYQTSSMTCIERSDDHAHNICSSSDVSSMDTEIVSERNFGPSETGDEMLPGADSDRMGMKKKRLKTDSTQTCVGQLVEVTCRSSSESSTSTVPLISSQNLQRSVRRLCGDSLVTLPKQCKGYILPTKVDKVIPMTTIDFRGASEYVEVPISLKVNIETIVSCCLRDKNNPKKMRVKFSRIGGEVKNVQATEPNVNALVLKSIRTNVVACVDRSDERDGYESINLNLEDEYSHSPHRRVLETLPVSVTGNQTKRVDRVWVALSGINPESDELGSITVELQCHVLRTCKAQLQGKINGAHVLLFKDPRPVTLEGDIYTSLGQESFFELNIRYQLEISYIEPCKPFPQEARPYFFGKRKTEVIDFDCILEYHARNLLCC